MKKNTIILIIALLFSAALHAGDFTVAQLNDLTNGLTALDGYAQEVKQGDAPSKIIPRYYQFSADARWKIASDLIAIRQAADTLALAKTGLRKQYGLDDPNPKAGNETKAEADYQQILAKPINVKLLTLTKADLNLGENPIPGTVLLQLAPVLAEK